MRIDYQLKKLNSGRDYIAEHYSRPFNLNAAAKSAHMSSYHFLRVFKNVYGETPNEFFIRLRIEEAKKMLITEDMSVTEICERVGYVSLGSFSSLFLKQVGMPPSRYRRKLWSLSSEPFRYPLQSIPSCYSYHFAGKPII